MITFRIFRYSYIEVSNWAWYCLQLGWYGEDLAPHLLQWAASCPRGPPMLVDRSSVEPKGKQRKDDSDLLWDLQLTSSVCRHPSSHVIVRFWSYHWFGHGLWWWCFPHCSSLWRLCPSTRDWSSGFGWSKLDWLLDEDLDRERLLPCHLCRAWNCQRYQGMEWDFCYFNQGDTKLWRLRLG